MRACVPAESIVVTTWTESIGECFFYFFYFLVSVFLLLFRLWLLRPLLGKQCNAGGVVLSA